MFLFIIKLLLVGTLLTGVALYVTMLALPLMTFRINDEDIRLKFQKYGVIVSTILICGFAGSYQANLAYSQDTMIGYWSVVAVSAMVYYLLWRLLGKMYMQLLVNTAINDDPISELDDSAFTVQAQLILRTKVFHPAGFAICLVFPLQSNEFYLGLPKELVGLF